VTDQLDFERAVEEIVAGDPRFRPEAYTFLVAALDLARRKLGRRGHVSGRELLFGVRDYGMQRFGPLTAVVFRQWGVKTTIDFGHIVENLVSAGILSKQAEDSIESFRDVFDFDQEFVRGYRW
jgi:uncharacterized repeat protein (TIGR04138 family)